MDQKILENIEQVKDVNIGDLLPNCIDGVTIEVQNNQRQIYLPITMTGERFHAWKKRRGGVFYKDVFLWLSGSPYGKYVEAIGENVHLILRIIDEEDLEVFQIKKLANGKVKDQNVMILKNLLEEDGLEDPEYVRELDLGDSETEENPEIDELTNIPLEDDEANSSRSVSLFD
jgi:hypothetical protein